MSAAAARATILERILGDNDEERVPAEGE